MALDLTVSLVVESASPKDHKGIHTTVFRAEIQPPDAIAEGNSPHVLGHIRYESGKAQGFVNGEVYEISLPLRLRNGKKKGKATADGDGTGASD